jgi:hypothetical protein
VSEVYLLLRLYNRATVCYLSYMTYTVTMIRAGKQVEVTIWAGSRDAAMVKAENVFKGDYAVDAEVTA